MYKLILFLFAIFISINVTHVYGDQEHITPFWASCPACETYGYCQRTLTYSQAEQNLREYYSRRGFSIAIVRHFGRFLEANVYRSGTVVERVILDRQTGRIKAID